MELDLSNLGTIIQNPIVLIVLFLLLRNFDFGKLFGPFKPKPSPDPDTPKPDDLDDLDFWDLLRLLDKFNEADEMEIQDEIRGIVAKRLKSGEWIE